MSTPTTYINSKHSSDLDKAIFNVAMSRSAKINPVFNQVSKKHQESFKAWLVRQYFKANNDVTEDNVLEIMSQSNSGCPLSPTQATNFFNEIIGLKGSMTTSDEVSLLDQSEEDSTPKAKYQTGVITLREIGTSLGGISATMVTKITDSAVSKLYKLTQGILPENLDFDQEVELDQKLNSAMTNAISIYLDLFEKSDKKIDVFLKTLKENRLINSSEMINVSDREIETLVYLARLDSKEAMSRALRVDIGCQDNVFKTFQSTYSRTLYPAPRRGRPRKNSL